MPAEVSNIGHLSPVGGDTVDVELGFAITEDDIRPPNLDHLSPVGGDTVDVELGFAITEDDIRPPKIMPGSPILGKMPRPSEFLAAKGSRSISFAETAVWIGALFLHRHKTALLRLVLVQAVAYNLMKMLTHKHHKMIDYCFCTTGILLGVSLILSSGATLLMHSPSRWLTSFLVSRGGRPTIAKKFPESHGADKLCDGLAGLLMVNSSVNTLTWYISNLPQMPWTDVPGHYAWHVLSWMLTIVWAAFSLGIYSKSQITLKLPSSLHSPPSLLTTRVYAVLKHVVASKLFRFCSYIAFSANFCILALLCWDVNISQRAGSSEDFESKRKWYGGALIFCDTMHLISEVIKPCIIDGWLNVVPVWTRSLTLFCLGITITLVMIPVQSPHLLTVCVVTVLLHMVGLLCVAVSVMGWVARSLRLIPLEPPIQERRGIEKVATVVTPTASTQTQTLSKAAARDLEGCHSPVGQRIPEIQTARLSSMSLAGQEAIISPQIATLASDSNRPLRILSLDGGGCKGLNTIMMLQAIEKGCGKPIRELFDLICGTSIGSCIGASVSHGVSPDCVMTLVEGLCFEGSENCGAVFPTKSTWRLLRKGHKISGNTMSRYMDHVLRKIGCQDNQPMSAPKTVHANGIVPHYFCVTTQEQPHDRWLPFVLSNYDRQGSGFSVAGTQGWPLNRQLLSSCAAPTYFPSIVDPASGVQYVDGGIVANNPSMIAIQEARAIWPGRPVGCVVSLGTGTSVATEQTKAGLTYWAGKMLSMPTDTYRVHKEMEALLPCLNGSDCVPASYFRLEPVIQNLELDECRKYVLDEMKDKTASYIAAQSAHIERLCSVLLLLSGEREPYPKLLEQIRSEQLSEGEVRRVLAAVSSSPCNAPASIVQHI
jgi:predicted acylesterase/phospholipase RssA